MSRSGLGEAWNDWYSTVLIRGMPLSESDQDSAAPEAVRRAFFDVYGYRFELRSSCRSAFDGLCQIRDRNGTSRAADIAAQIARTGKPVLNGR